MSDPTATHTTLEHDVECLRGILDGWTDLLLMGMPPIVDDMDVQLIRRVLERHGHVATWTPRSRLRSTQ